MYSAMERYVDGSRETFKSKTTHINIPKHTRTDSGSQKHRDTETHTNKATQRQRNTVKPRHSKKVQQRHSDTKQSETVTK